MISPVIEQKKLGGVLPSILSTMAAWHTSSGWQAAH
jgi:hypothetical protein